jgi:hypothetical protein
MIFLAMNEHREANLFIDKDGVRVLQDILNGYENLSENDHDHIQFMDGLVSTNSIKGYELDETKMAGEITIRFRAKLEMK